MDDINIFVAMLSPFCLYPGVADEFHCLGIRTLHSDEDWYIESDQMCILWFIYISSIYINIWCFLFDKWGKQRMYM